MSWVDDWNESYLVTESLLGQHRAAAREALDMLRELHGVGDAQVHLVISLEDRFAGPLAGSMSGRAADGNFADWTIVVGDSGIEDIERVDYDSLPRGCGRQLAAPSSKFEALLIYNHVGDQGRARGWLRRFGER